MTILLPTDWIAQCAIKLKERWTTVDQAMLQEVAMDLWMDPDFRTLGPIEAAESWLAPVSKGPAGDLPGFSQTDLARGLG